MARARVDAAPQQFAEVQAAVREHLGRGDTKAAVELARSAHARLGSPAAETLAVDAYLARVAHLEARGLGPEARQLAESVRKRFPTARARLAEVPGRKTLEDLVRPLADPDLPASAREALEAEVARDVTDLQALGACAALGEEHPLRRAARALAAALDAVARGPVEDEALLLPEVSRRSPLAPWKGLVRAIAHYHRGEDARCEEQLARLPAGAAPARAAAPLRALLRGDPAPGFPRVGSSLKDALARLDAAFAAGRPKAIVRAIEAAAAACAAEAPDLVDPLRRRVAVRGPLAGLSPERVRRALGGPPRRDAAFWQLLAAAWERRGHRVAAAAAWLEALRVGALEGRFAAEGREAALLSLHAADLLRTARDDDDHDGDDGDPYGDDDDPDEGGRGEAPDFSALYRDQPPDVAARAPSGPAVLDPGALYATACRLDPHAEAFQRWLAWARGAEAHTKAADAVAATWHAALPGDPAPLLYLVASAEARGALAQALRHLEAAERLDGVDPAVRRARFRLLVATARRHAKQGKAHLLRADLEALAGLAEARGGLRPALVAALGAVEADLRGAADEGARRRAAAREVLGSDAAADLLLDAVAVACGRRGAPPGAVRGEGLCGAAGRVALLARDAGLALDLPARLGPPLARDAADHGAAGAEPAELAALAEALLEARGGADGRREAAYAVAGAGLRRGGPTAARLLLLRARALPDFSRARRRRLAQAAAELARRQRDAALVAEAVEVARAAAPWAPAEVPSPAALDEVVAREAGERAYPVAPAAEDLDRRCHCPACRARAEDDEDDGDDEDDEDDEDGPGAFELGPGLPPALAAALEELLRRADRSGRLPDPATLAREDPALARRITEALLEAEAEAPPRGRRGGRRR